jgi:hypothetical protein
MRSTRGWTLAAAAAMSLGAVGLAPSVVRYWSARLGAGDRERRVTAQALKPGAASAEEDAAAESRPSRRAVSKPERPQRDTPRLPPEPTAPEPASDESTPHEENETSAVPAEMTAIEAEPSELPPRAPAREDELKAESAPGPELHEETEAPPPEDEPEPAPTRRVSITVLEARTQPGLCKGSTDAIDARDALIARFHAFSWGGASQLYLDPRLEPAAYPRLVADLMRAEKELVRVLQLAPARPDVFAYYDTELLLAAGCTNENVVAYYDGALHVVPSHDDVETSILHEYTHHALTSAGLLGPAWAQEGIAMHVAGETWWRGGWMTRVLERPFSLEVMESAVPYTLRSDQAGLFYAQSAAMVACASRDDPRGLAGLVESLAAGNERGELRYQLPSAAAPIAWRSCFTDLAR